MWNFSARVIEPFTKNAAEKAKNLLGINRSIEEDVQHLVSVRFQYVETRATVFEQVAWERVTKQSGTPDLENEERQNVEAATTGPTARIAQDGKDSDPVEQDQNHEDRKNDSAPRSTNVSTETVASINQANESLHSSETTISVSGKTSEIEQRQALEPNSCDILKIDSQEPIAAAVSDHDDPSTAPMATAEAEGDAENAAQTSKVLSPSSPAAEAEAEAGVDISMANVRGHGVTGIQSTVRGELLCDSAVEANVARGAERGCPPKVDGQPPSGHATSMLEEEVNDTEEVGDDEQWPKTQMRRRSIKVNSCLLILTYMDGLQIYQYLPQPQSNSTEPTPKGTLQASARDRARVSEVGGEGEGECEGERTIQNELINLPSRVIGGLSATSSVGDGRRLASMRVARANTLLSSRTVPSFVSKLSLPSFVPTFTPTGLSPWTRHLAGADRTFFQAPPSLSDGKPHVTRGGKDGEGGWSGGGTAPTDEEALVSDTTAAAGIVGMGENGRSLNSKRLESQLLELCNLSLPHGASVACFIRGPLQLPPAVAAGAIATAATSAGGKEEGREGVPPFEIAYVPHTEPFEVRILACHDSGTRVVARLEFPMPIVSLSVLQRPSTLLVFTHRQLKIFDRVTVRSRSAAAGKEGTEVHKSSSCGGSRESNAFDSCEEELSSSDGEGGENGKGDEMNGNGDSSRGVRSNSTLRNSATFGLAPNAFKPAFDYQPEERLLWFESARGCLVGVQRVPRKPPRNGRDNGSLSHRSNANKGLRWRVVCVQGLAAFGVVDQTSVWEDCGMLSDSSDDEAEESRLNDVQKAVLGAICFHAKGTTDFGPNLLVVVSASGDKLVLYKVHTLTHPHTHTSKARKAHTHHHTHIQPSIRKRDRATADSDRHASSLISPDNYRVSQLLEVDLAFNAPWQKFRLPTVTRVARNDVNDQTLVTSATVLSNNVRGRTEIAVAVSAPTYTHTYTSDTVTHFILYHNLSDL